MSERFIVSATDHLPQNRIGMTVREEIASRVLAGAMNKAYSCCGTEEDWGRLIVNATIIADALIEELERTKK